MRLGTLLRLSLAGTRTDTVRVSLTAATALLATLSVLAALTVVTIRGYAYQYTNHLLVEPGLRPGVAFALLLLSVPVLVLAGQCARLGAPARDRRLAAVRLAGGSPRQVATVAAAESGVATALGAGLGVVGYFVGRTLLHRPDGEGRLPLPTDHLPPWPVFVVVLVGLPLAATTVAVLLLRRSAFTPFGVVSRQRTSPPRPWPAALIIPGVAAVALLSPLVAAFERRGEAAPALLIGLVLAGGALLAVLGVVLGTAWVSYTSGRLLHRVARGPAALLAARRLMADPWSGSRVLAALLACVVVAAGAAGVRAWFVAGFEAERERNRATAVVQNEPFLDDSRHYAFYDRAFDLVNATIAVAVVIAGLGLLVFLVEGIVARRRAYAALVATGTPRGTLARALSWQVLAPVVPAVALALAVGVTLPRGISREERAYGGTVSVCTVGDWEQCPAGSPNLRTVELPDVVRPVAVPVAELLTIGGVAIAAVAVTLGMSLWFLRASTEVTELRTS